MLESSKQKIIAKAPEPRTLVRPKSFFVKTIKKFDEFPNCQGWVTVTGNYHREEDEPFSNVLKF